MRAWSLVLVLVLSGCLAGEKDPGQDARDRAPAIEEASLPLLVQDHDHNNASAHAGSHGFELVGYSNGVDQSGNPNSIPGDAYYTELALRNGYLYMARGNVIDPTQAIPTPVCSELPAQDPSHGGFSIINVLDPENPTVVGNYNALTGSDIEVSMDGHYVFFATQRNCLTEIGGNLQLHQDPPGTAPRGIHVVDVSDPTAPSLAFYQPLPVNGPHTVTYHERDGQELLVVSTYDLYEDPGSGTLRALSATQRVLIFEIERGPDEGVGLRPVNTFFLTDNPPAQKMYFPHDARVQRHPVTGQDLMYVAYWDKGLQIVDITDLNGPLTAEGGYTDFSPSSRNNIHLAMPFPNMIEGKHVTVTEPEIITADETGYITFLDTTDPTRPSKLGHWTLPGDLFVQYLEFSPHNFAFHDNKVILAHNHGGLWSIDVGHGNLASPQTAGFFMDVLQRDDPPRPQPYFWGAVVEDQLIYAVDESSGLYILRHD